MSYRRSDSPDDFSGFESEMSLDEENPDRGGRQRGGGTNPFMNQGGGELGRILQLISV